MRGSEAKRSDYIMEEPKATSDSGEETAHGRAANFDEWISENPCPQGHEDGCQRCYIDYATYLAKAATINGN